MLRRYFVGDRNSIRPVLTRDNYLSEQLGVENDEKVELAVKILYTCVFFYGFTLSQLIR